MIAFRRLRVAVFLALRSLARGNAGVTAMSVSMMTAVFVSVMFLPSLIAGATTGVTSQLVGTLTGDLSITPDGQPSLADASAYLEQVRAAEGVAAATGIRRVGTQVGRGGDTLAVGVDAIDPESYAEVFTTPQHLLEGEYLRPDDTDGILLGIGVAGADETTRRTYSSSLKTVHAGDSVDVTLSGGETHTFVVRGVYENGFPLSDQGAFITVAAADSRVSDTQVSAEIRKAFDALDEISAAVGDAADSAGELAGGADALASAVGSLDASATRLASGAWSSASGATDLRDMASSLASSAAAAARAGKDLSRALDSAGTSVAQPAVAAASASAATAGDVAEDAAALVADCPPAQPAYCGSVARHAALTQDAATAAATSAKGTRALADSLAEAAVSAHTLAGSLGSLSAGAASLADGAAQVARGSTDVANGAASLADSTDTLLGEAERVAAAAHDLADALQTSTKDSAAPDQASRDDVLARLDSTPSAPSKDSVTRIVIRTDLVADAAVVEDELEPLRAGVQFLSPADLSSMIQDQLDTFTLIDNIMRVMSLLVAAITVLIITYVDLTNRRRQIGIERAIGIRSASIVGSYVIRSVITAAVGTVVGWLLFRFVLVPVVEQHPFQFPSGPVVLEIVPQVTRSNVVILLVVAALAALLPAVRTVRMRILDAIWGA